MRRLTVEQYRLLAKQCDLEYLEVNAPRNIHVPVRWRCLRCNREHDKSYSAVKYKSVCLCRKAVALTKYDYENRAASFSRKYGIQLEFAHNFAPQNVRQNVIWVRDDGTHVLCSYLELMTQKAAERIKNE